MASPGQETDTHTLELSERISWIIRLRWIAAAGVAATVSLAPRLFHVDLAQRNLYLVTAGLVVYNAALWAVARWVPRATEGPVLFFANLQISTDLVFLTALLHFSGGIENPFICYFVFHIVLASILLSRRATYLQAALAMSLLVAMAVSQAVGILPHYHLVGLGEQERYRLPVYVFGVLFAVGTMLSFVAFMATSITARLREREAQIVQLSTSLRERAADLQEAYGSLRRLEKEKSEYMLRVAHDIRSPLATVERMLAVISEGRTGQICGRTHQMLDRSRRRVRQLLDVARDLLALSRAREAHHRLQPQRVELSTVLASVHGDLLQRAQSASVNLTIRTDPALPQVSGDSDSLGELLDNLISNAIKYTPPGGDVRVELRQEGGQIGIRISDSGIGIPVEERDLIFDDFYRASNAQKTGKEGTGLGLSIVRAIVEAHRGMVDVQSEVGSGSTFRVLLPTASSGEEATPPEQQEVRNSAQTGRAVPSHPGMPQGKAGRAQNEL